MAFRAPRLKGTGQPAARPDLLRSVTPSAQQFGVAKINIEQGLLTRIQVEPSRWGEAE
ncbi:MAG: hypothetical protein O7G83_13680 [Proteobacteria bacterium]|nr:hypothetical protein [Pseudomonadota bacterium]